MPRTGSSKEVQERWRAAQLKSNQSATERNMGVRGSSNPGSGAERRSGIIQETSRHWSDPGDFDYIARNATRLSESVLGSTPNYGAGTTFMGTPKHGSISHDQFEPDESPIDSGEFGNDWTGYPAENGDFGGGDGASE